MSDGPSSETVPAVVLAGGKAKPEVVAATGVANRALVQVDGRTMLDHVVGALVAAESVGRIVVVGDVPDSESYARVPDRGSMVENMYAGLEVLGPSPFALIATSDIPYVTRDGVDDFVQRAVAAGGDFVYPIVRVADCYAKFPGLKRTAVKIREGEFTGGNIVLVRPDAMARMHDRISRAYALRKSPAKLALMLGLGTVTLFGLSILIRRGLLSIPRLEAAVSRLMGGKARAAISPYPELATDIDSAEDLAALARR